MNPIRHLISIVFLFCGLTAWGGERGYDQNDMVGTYKYEIPEYVLNLHLHTDNTFMVTSTVSDDTYKHFGKWEVKEDLVVLHFDEHEADTVQVHELDKYVMKEMEILDKDSLFWGHHLQEGYEKRVVLQRNDISGSSRTRKGKNEVWKDLIEQVVRDVVG